MPKGVVEQAAADLLAKTKRCGKTAEAKSAAAAAALAEQVEEIRMKWFDDYDDHMKNRLEVGPLGALDSWIEGLLEKLKKEKKTRVFCRHIRVIRSAFCCEGSVESKIKVALADAPCRPEIVEALDQAESTNTRLKATSGLFTTLGDCDSLNRRETCELLGTCIYKKVNIAADRE